MRIILVSNLYPHGMEPMRALYNQRHFQALRDLGHKLEVIAPLPWFPGKRGMPTKSEYLNGVLVSHPRYWYTPGFAIHEHWRFYAAAVRVQLERRIQASDEAVHVVLGFVYPDAVAMAPVCEALGVPYSVLVLGSDFRLRMQQAKFKPLVHACLMRAPHVFCPGGALRRDIIDSGVPGEKVHAFKNGVEQEVFYYEAQADHSERQEILFVGNLVDVKAPDRLLRAFAQAVPQMDASICLGYIGAGPLCASLKNLAEELGIVDRVNFLGRQTPESVAARMRSALGLCLCSRSEGMPNVVIEALACGCPVVATAVGEVPYLIEPSVNGFVLAAKEREESEIVAELAAALQDLGATDFDRATIAAKMSDFTWKAAAQVVVDVITHARQTLDTKDVF